MTSHRKRRGEAAGESSLQKVKACKFFHADAQGVVAERAHTLWLDKRDPPSFVFKVPAYVVTALACTAQVNKPTADEVTREFKAVLRAYDEWVKKAKAEPVIVLNLSYDARLAEEEINNDAFHFANHDSFDRRAKASVSYTLAFRVNGNLHERVPLDIRKPFITFKEGLEREEEIARCEQANAAERALDVGGGFKVGHRSPGHNDCLILDYTPELHAKIDQVIDALTGAARVLRDIEQSKDAAKKLLSLGSGTPLLSAPAAARKAAKC